MTPDQVRGGGAPSADAIALALVRAAKALGENAEMVAIGGAPNLCAGYHALCALSLAFPAACLDPLAEAWGVSVFKEGGRIMRMDYWGGRVVDTALIFRIAEELTVARAGAPR